MDAFKRIGADHIGDRWVGTYQAPDGRVAVVTEEAETENAARAAARRWVADGVDKDNPPPGHVYLWRKSDRYTGRWDAYLSTPVRMERVPLARP